MRSVDTANWMLMRMSFRVFFPNACVGFFCEILVLEEKSSTPPVQMLVVLLKRKAVHRGTLLLSSVDSLMALLRKSC